MQKNDLLEQINLYLSGGGLFNPELANHVAVRDLLIECREALAQPEQEPVAWLIWLHGPAGHFDHKQFAELEFERRNKEYPDPDRKLLPLYTTPPQRKPPQFPTMLRKMWSGTEVQEWINENWR